MDRSSAACKRKDGLCHCPDCCGVDTAATRRPSDIEDAKVVWRIVDDLNTKARLLEDDAARIRVEAQRLNKVAAAIADGRPVEDEL